MTTSDRIEMDIIEDALQTWPLAEAPQDFSQRTLRRIESDRSSRLIFRLTWLDYALGFFAVAVTLLAILVWNLLPDLFVMELTYRIFVLLHVAQYQTVLIFSLLGIAGFFLFIFLTAILFTFPAQPVQNQRFAHK